MIIGYDYEKYCAEYLESLEFHSVEVTKASQDQGVDIIAYKNGSKYAVQCKYYSSAVGNKAIQEVVAGAKLYNCDKKMVITNNTYTKSAVELADSNDVILKEYIDIEKMILNVIFENENIDLHMMYGEKYHNLQSVEEYEYVLDNIDFIENEKKQIQIIEDDYIYIVRSYKELCAADA